MEPEQSDREVKPSCSDEPSTSAGKRRTSADEQEARKELATDRKKGGTYRAQLPQQTRKNETPANRVRLQANYFRLKRTPAWGIHRYHVSLEPPVEKIDFRRALIAQHNQVLGKFFCDGAQLFTVHRLDGGGDLSLTSTSREGQRYAIQFKYTGCIPRDSREFLHILNLIQRRATKALDLKLVGRNFYDPHAKIPFEQFQLELWPGFDTSIREHSSDLLLNCDVVYKVMHTATVYDVLQQTIKADPRSWRHSFQKKVLGMTVFTGHNNRTYRVDDVDFDISPMTTFRRRDVQISIDGYYMDRYNINIKDKRQPLLIAKVKERGLRGGDSERIDWLVPELCRLTGLTERQRTDFSLKNAMRPYAQMNARVKKDRLLAFNQRIQETPASRAVFDEWSLEVDRELVSIDGVHMKPRSVRFGGNESMSFHDASWDSIWANNKRLLNPVALERWCVFFPEQLLASVRPFVQRIRKVAKCMGFEVSDPTPVRCRDERDMIRRIDDYKRGGYQLFFFVITTPKLQAGMVYASIKKKCHVELDPVPSQIATKLILSKPSDSVATKIAIQMCTKLGGAPWCPHIPPLKGAMTIGFDMSKDAVNKSITFGCLVATMDLERDVAFFSRVSSAKGNERICGHFALSVVMAIRHWREKYGSLPETLIVYRGGVGDGDLEYLEQVEIAALKESLAHMYGTAELRLLYVVVSKKVNTRIFEGNGNPRAGTVVDDVIKLAGRDEFFMISATSHQGTVAPTNYHILDDTTGLPINHIQIWTWNQAHLYFNWCGTIGVPAVLQYATKLCFLVTNYLHCVPADGQQDKLYFL